MLETGKLDMTCEHCGVVNEVSYTDFPERDKGVLLCAGCGGTLHQWKGTRDFHTATLKDDPSRPE